MEDSFCKWLASNSHEWIQPPLLSTHENPVDNQRNIWFLPPSNKGGLEKWVLKRGENFFFFQDKGGLAIKGVKIFVKSI